VRARPLRSPAGTRGWQMPELFACVVCAGVCFMASVALWAEAMNHHPDWATCIIVSSLNLNTHDVWGISTLDFTLARRIKTRLLDRGACRMTNQVRRTSSRCANIGEVAEKSEPICIRTTP